VPITARQSLALPPLVTAVGRDSVEPTLAPGSEQQKGNSARAARCSSPSRLSATQPLSIRHPRAITARRSLSLPPLVTAVGRDSVEPTLAPGSEQQKGNSARAARCSSPPRLSATQPLSIRHPGAHHGSTESRPTPSRHGGRERLCRAHSCPRLGAAKGQLRKGRQVFITISALRNAAPLHSPPWCPSRLDGVSPYPLSSRPDVPQPTRVAVNSC
jgi:hypothetical protein